MPEAENNKGVVSKKDYKSANQKAGKNYLLVIGIDEYVHCPILNNAVKDAQDFITILTKKYEFNEKHLLFIKNEEANKDTIIEAFRDINQW